MVRFISLSILASVLAAMIQSVDTTGPVNPTPFKGKVVAADHKQQRTQVNPAQQPKIKQQTRSLRDELMGSLKSAKVNKSSSDFVADAIIEANGPMVRSFPVDETVYEQQGEMEQPLALEALNEYDIEYELKMAGLTAEQNQVIADAIAEANFDKQ